MREIKSITELLRLMSNKQCIYQEINGKKNILTMDDILEIRYPHLNRMVLEGILYYDILS